MKPVLVTLLLAFSATPIASAALAHVPGYDVEHHGVLSDGCATSVWSYRPLGQDAPHTILIRQFCASADCAQAGSCLAFDSCAAWEGGFEEGFDTSCASGKRIRIQPHDGVDLAGTTLTTVQYGDATGELVTRARCPGPVPAASGCPAT